MLSVASLILTILALLVLIIFIGSLYAFFYAIFQFIFSSGDADKVKSWWNSIRYMALGIMFTLTILFVFPILLKKASVPGYQYYTASNIFARVGKITGGLLSLGQEAFDTYSDGAVLREWLYDGTDWTLEPQQGGFADLEL